MRESWRQIRLCVWYCLRYISHWPILAAELWLQELWIRKLLQQNEKAKLQEVLPGLQAEVIWLLGQIKLAYNYLQKLSKLSRNKNGKKWPGGGRDLCFQCPCDTLKLMWLKIKKISRNTTKYWAEVDVPYFVKFTFANSLLLWCIHPSFAAKTRDPNLKEERDVLCITRLQRTHQNSARCICSCTSGVGERMLYYTRDLANKSVFHYRTEGKL